MSATTDHRIHHETVKALLDRYPLWRYPDFQRLIQYQPPRNLQKLREEMVKLRQQGWTEKRIAQLLRCSRKTVIKWLRRARQAASQPNDRQLWLFDLSRAPHRTSRKVFFGAIHAVLTLQKKYGYAGAFRIKGYLEQDYHIHLSEATIRKIMALNRRLHLAPQRPVTIIEPRFCCELPVSRAGPTLCNVSNLLTEYYTSAVERAVMFVNRLKSPLSRNSFVVLGQIEIDADRKDDLELCVDIIPNFLDVNPMRIPVIVNTKSG